jgi:serine O-acetyltransferase
MGLAERLAGHASALNWHAVHLYRLSRWLWLRDHRALAILTAAISRLLTGVEIPPSAEFGEGLVIMHGNGIVVHPWVRAGARCVLYQQVTLGSNSEHGNPPTLGDDVIVFPGAKVVGAIRLGDGSQIGANSFVSADVAPGHVVRGGERYARVPSLSS